MAIYLSKKELKQAFVQNELVIDCIKITLTQNYCDKPKVWSGTGYLEIHNRAGIKARLISNETLNESDRFAAFVNSANDVVSGQLFPKNKYYCLCAEDVSGQIWVNPEVSIKSDYHESGTVITFECDWIQSTEKAEGIKDEISMLFLDKLPFPLNKSQKQTTESNGKTWTNITTNLSNGQAAGFDFTYKPSNDNLYHELYVSAPEHESMPINFDSRLIEAIRFTSAKKISYAICEKVHAGVRTLEISKSAIQPSNMGLFQSPLPNNPSSSVDFFHLYDCYLKYSISVADGENFSYLSQKLGALYQLHQVPLESIALILSVGIEGIVKTEFTHLLLEQDQSILKDVKTIKNSLESYKLSESATTRIAGLLDSIKGTRPVDKLMIMAKEEVVTSENVTAWKKLRDTTAHSSLHIPPDQQQEFLNSIFNSMVLMYKLVFLCISYNGHYLDFSRVGWPVLEFRSSEFSKFIPPKPI